MEFEGDRRVEERMVCHRRESSVARPPLSVGVDLCSTLINGGSREKTTLASEREEARMKRESCGERRDAENRFEPQEAKKAHKTGFL